MSKRRVIADGSKEHPYEEIRNVQGRQGTAAQKSVDTLMVLP